MSCLHIISWKAERLTIVFNWNKYPFYQLSARNRLSIRHYLSYSILPVSAAETGTKKQKEFPACIMCIVSKRVRCAPVHLRHSKLHNIITTLQGLPSSSQHSTRQHPCGSQALECQHTFTLLPAAEIQQTSDTSNKTLVENRRWAQM